MTATTLIRFQDLLIPQALAQPLQQLQQQLDEAAFANVLDQLSTVSEKLEKNVERRIELNIKIDNLVIDNRKFVQRQERTATEGKQHEAESTKAESIFDQL